MLPFQARVELGAKAKKGYSAFPKTPALNLSCLGYLVTNLFSILSDFIPLFTSKYIHKIWHQITNKS